MSEQTTNECTKCKKMDEAYFSYKLKSCDVCTDKTRAKRLSLKDYLKGHQKQDIMKVQQKKQTCNDKL